jgi:phosphoribosyl 1,2-cyclic phosphate phosphodiesterase
MADVMRFTILGCGSSPGVPRINGDWGACDPANPKNRRRRASLLVERIAGNGAKTTVVIDTGPDFRDQMITAQVRAIDAVVYTHAHADHIHGIDDLRGFWLSQKRLIDIHADAYTLSRLREAFAYCFTTPPGSGYPPVLCPHEIDHHQAFDISGNGGIIRFEPLVQNHGSILSLGYRIGDLAYCPDVSGFPPETAARLAGLDVLVIDALQYRPHPSHLSLDESLEWIRKLRPRRAILTHMHTPLDYAVLCQSLPAGIEPGYDGLSVESFTVSIS